MNVQDIWGMFCYEGLKQMCKKIEETGNREIFEMEIWDFIVEVSLEKCLGIKNDNKLYNH